MSFSMHPPPWEAVKKVAIVIIDNKPAPGSTGLPKIISRSKLDRDPVMEPVKFSLRPPEVKSEPNTPIFATDSQPEEAPNDWFTPITHKEKLAILTMETVPELINKKDFEDNASSPTQHFSPALLPYAERMKFIFARVMAKARLESESENGPWIMESAEANKDKSKGKGKESEKETPTKSIYPNDVMTSLEIEAFMAGIEEVRHPARDNLVLFRRYWRFLEAPNGLLQAGGVVSTRGTTGPGESTVKADLQKRWHEIPKKLLAEYLIGKDGVALTGRFAELDEIGGEPRSFKKKKSKKGKKKGKRSAHK